MKNKILFLLLFALLISCKKDDRKQTVERIVTEWTGKTITFPKDISCKIMGRDTVAPDLFQKTYKVLLYVDSVGCMACKLHLREWKKIIRETDSIVPDQVEFLFFFNPKKSQKLDSLMKRECFAYSIFIDENNEIDRLNHFPKDMLFKSFLLDKNNKVLLVGSPVLNPKIWDLYKQQITGIKLQKDTPSTQVEVKQSEIEIQNLQVGKVSQIFFSLKNTGKLPFLIEDIKSSCGCTVPTWDRVPIELGSETQIRVDVKPESTGHFRKTVDVYGNITGQKIQLTIIGNVKN